MVGPAQAALGAAEAFAASPDVAHIATLNANLDALLDLTAALIVAAPILSKRQQNDSITSFRAAATKHLEAVAAEAESVTQELAAAGEQAGEETRLSSQFRQAEGEPCCPRGIDPAPESKARYGDLGLPEAVS